MAQGFGESRSSEESEEVRVKVKSDEDLHLLLQEGSIITGGGTDTEQLQDTFGNLSPLHGGDEHGSLGHTVYSTSNPVSDENCNVKLLIPKCDDELAGHVAASSYRTYQEIIDAQQKKVQYSEAKIQQLELELGKISFLEDKQKRDEKVKAYGHSSRTHASTKRFLLQQRLLEISNSLSDIELWQMKFLVKPRVNAFRLAKIREGFELFEELDASGVLSCTYVRDLLRGIQRFDLLEKLDVPPLGRAERDSALCMEEAPEQEPRLRSTNTRTVDQITESSMIPPRNNNVDTLPENPSQLSSRDNMLELRSSYKDGLVRVEGDPLTELRETGTCILEDQHGLLVTAAEGESQEHANQLEKESQECDTKHQIPQVEFKRNSSYEGSQSPTGQTMLDRITESPVISPGDHSLDLLSASHGGSLVGDHMPCNEGDDSVSGTNKAVSVSNMSSGNLESSGRGTAVFAMNAVCGDLPMQSLSDGLDEEESVPACRLYNQSASDSTTPTDKWTQFGARPKTRPPPPTTTTTVTTTTLEPSLVESLISGLPNTIPVDSSESGINEEFLKRHSQDRSLFESQPHYGTENMLSSDASLLGTLYMESMMNFIEATRIKPYTVDDEVASGPDDQNRLSLPLLPMGENERGYAVGGSTFEESLNGTRPDCTLNSDYPPSTSKGNMAHVAAGNFDLLCPYSGGRSNRALNGVLSEAESTAAHPYASENASSNKAVDQEALEVAVSEPCRAESASSRDSMSGRNAGIDCNGINLALLALAQLIQEVYGASGERQIEGEQQREARMRAWNSNRFQEQAGNFIIESLDSTPDSARAQERREAAIRASTEEMRRGPSSCSGPGEHSCVCLENNESQACRVHGTIIPERCQPDSAHDMCCKCLEDVSSGSMILLCSHHVHTDCLVGMIQTGELNCPICGRAFLRRG